MSVQPLMQSYDGFVVLSNEQCWVHRAPGCVQCYVADGEILAGGVNREYIALVVRRDDGGFLHCLRGQQSLYVIPLSNPLLSRLSFQPVVVPTDNGVLVYLGGEPLVTWIEPVLHQVTVYHREWHSVAVSSKIYEASASELRVVSINGESTRVFGFVSQFTDWVPVTATPWGCVVQVDSSLWYYSPDVPPGGGGQRVFADDVQCAYLVDSSLLSAPGGLSIIAILLPGDWQLTDWRGLVVRVTGEHIASLVIKMEGLDADLYDQVKWGLANGSLFGYWEGKVWSASLGSARRVDERGAIYELCLGMQTGQPELIPVTAGAR